MIKWTDGTQKSLVKTDNFYLKNNQLFIGGKVPLLYQAVASWRCYKMFTRILLYFLKLLRNLEKYLALFHKCTLWRILLLEQNRYYHEQKTIACKMIATIFRCIFLFSNSPIEYFQLPEIFTSFLPERIVSDRQ